ncbi:Bacterial regulatory protein, Fis family [Sphingobacterium daejeonense]|nr:Bacterial regulatory protein, Fis family [Sphingobacterium daejeonense]
MNVLIILCDKKITEDDVLKFANPGGPAPVANNGTANNGNGFDMEQFTSFQDFKDFSECEFIKYKLERNNWNVSKTADDLDIQRSHLYSKIEKFGLKRD